MRPNLAAAVLAIAVLGPMAQAPAGAEPWSHARIAALPDSAFAVIETGAVDPAHLRAALARLPQVKWLDPASAEVARRHLEEHRKRLRPP